MPTAPIPDYWPLLEAYHRVREPLYRQIIADTLPRQRDPLLILDAGCGDAFYSRLLADTLRPDPGIIAFDNTRGLLPANTMLDRVLPCQGDMERAGLQPGAFDAVWLCRSLHSATDPVRRLVALARLLRPGGRLVVVENDFAHHPVLSWPADLEHKVFNAHFRYLQSHCPDGTSPARYHGARHLRAWLRQAGLRPAFLHTYVSEDAAPLTADIEEYWRLFMTWLGHRIFPYLSPVDVERYSDLCKPDSPNYLLAGPDVYCVELTTVACGIAPG